MTHKHHIQPKHMTGGIYDNSPDNITPLISVEQTKESNEKNRLSHLGRKCSEETKRKMSESHKKKNVI